MSEAEVLARRAQISEQLRAWAKKMRSRDTTITVFENWTRSITQATVDLLVRQAAGDSDECLARMRREFVVDDAYRLIPLDQRQGMREAARTARAEAMAELERRAACEASHA